MKKHTGVRPLFGRTPKRAEWRLLEDVALDMKDHIDANDLKVIRDIAQKGCIERYSTLSEYWGLQSITPVQPVGVRDACLYQLSSLLDKMQWDDSISPHQLLAANEKFDLYERYMREYNRIGYLRLAFSKDPQINAFVSRMQHFISQVLQPLNLDAVQEYARCGPGGTFGLSRQFGHRYYKYAALPYEVTSSAVPMARRLILKDERWKRAVIKQLVIRKLCWTPVSIPENCVYVCLNSACFTKIRLPCNNAIFRVVPGNRIDYVPKNEREARTIALEASMNVMLQLGVDGHVRNRLLKFGIDINDQSINQRLARQGSIDNLLSTLDLKGASDNISMRIIELLFPYEWVEYLYKLRSDVGFFPDGRSVRYEKLSSMGNGYTFAIETLVFAAVVYAVNPEVKFGKNAHVYGDDLVVATSDVGKLVDLLGLCGFLINTDKSFYHNTYVRESCGADYYKGQNFRPVFLKTTLDRLDVFAFYSFHNRLKEWFSRILHVEDPGCAQTLREWCVPRWRLYGPPSLEDQSGYLAISEPHLGRTRVGLFRHGRATACVETFAHAEGSEYFVLLANMLRGSRSSDAHEANQLRENADILSSIFGRTRLAEIPTANGSGSQFNITKYGRYKIRSSTDSGRAFAWPRQYYSL